MKTAIVTGASRGIGKAISAEFSKKGYNVVLISRHYAEVEQTAMEISNSTHGVCVPFECDIRNKNQMAEIFETVIKRFGSIDVLVNNAGVNSRKTLDQKKWSENFEGNLSGWDEEIAINLTGVYICSYLAGGYMIKQKTGCIINISSIKGKEATSSPGYGASKSGVIHLTKDFAKALAPYIRVNCVAPGFIDTGMTSELPDDKKNAYKKMIPQERFGTVDEVAKSVVFLASDDASYITGTTIDVNGGYLMV